MRGDVGECTEEPRCGKQPSYSDELLVYNIYSIPNRDLIVPDTLGSCVTTNDYLLNFIAV